MELDSYYRHTTLDDIGLTTYATRTDILAAADSELGNIDETYGEHVTVSHRDLIHFLTAWVARDGGI